MLLRVEAESTSTAASFFPFFFPPLFASRTQLPHLTFSICPLPRGQLARVSKRGHRTSWILLSFNVHSPSSPWWCTQISFWRYCSIKGLSEVAPEELQLFLCHTEASMYPGCGYWAHHICVMLWHLHSSEETQLQKRNLPPPHSVNKVQCWKSVSLPLEAYK